LFMSASASIAAGFLYFATSNRAIVPGRSQSIAEIFYEFIAKMLTEGAGKQGLQFFPLFFSLFMFVLTANLLGMFPYFFTVTRIASAAVTMIWLVTV
ncbi:F0F1 ATP synthase subunit A, partial [Rhizobium ruizarguesonis]